MAPFVFVGTVVTHLCGGSAGREGAALQMSGSLTDAFSRAIREGTPLPVTLESSIANMRVIDALFRSGQSQQWEAV